MFDADAQPIDAPELDSAFHHNTLSLRQPLWLVAIRNRSLRWKAQTSNAKAYELNRKEACTRKNRSLHLRKGAS
ncbi:hypothetical protein SUGI_0647120 [Cryptomeria japonica]|nr:hypothetical protein SUGI_0647120 [Cryptomeria japonica]